MKLNPQLLLGSIYRITASLLATAVTTHDLDPSPNTAMQEEVVGLQRRSSETRKVTHVSFMATGAWTAGKQAVRLVTKTLKTMNTEGL